MESWFCAPLFPSPTCASFVVSWPKMWAFFRSILFQCHACYPVKLCRDRADLISGIGNIASLTTLIQIFPRVLVFSVHKIFGHVFVQGMMHLVKGWDVVRCLGQPGLSLGFATGVLYDTWLRHTQKSNASCAAEVTTGSAHWIRCTSEDREEWKHSGWEAARFWDLGIS